MATKTMLTTAVLFVLAGAAPAAPAAPQESPADAPAESPPEESGSPRSQMRDPEDGAFDATAYLAKGGFLPMPFLITEPAVGFGGGIALTFLHDPLREDPWRKRDAAEVSGGRKAPPDITSLFGGGTENGTWFAGGAYLGFWREDTLRYRGVAMTGQINLDFYLADQAFGYGIDTSFLYQDLRWRVQDSSVFLGANYRISSNDVEFEGLSPNPAVSQEQRDAGLGLVAYWDTRDNIFTPISGQEIEAQTVFWDDAVGSESEFVAYEALVKSYHPLGDGHVLGWRVIGEHVESGAPFYLLPAVQLRGVPAARYQGTTAASAEVELRYQLRRRWSAIGFGGVGKSWSDALPDSDTILAGGVGFRYLISRIFNVTMGLDLAFGPEDTVLYIAVGSGL